MDVAYRISAAKADYYKLAQIWHRSDLRPRQKRQYFNVGILSKLAWSLNASWHSVCQ